MLLASNDGCPVQAYRVGDRLYATQFHPEPTAKAFTERMAVYRDDGYFDSRATTTPSPDACSRHPSRSLPACCARSPSTFGPSA